MTVKEFLDADTEAVRDLIANSNTGLDGNELCGLCEKDLIKVLNKAMNKDYPGFKKCPDRDDGMPLQFLTVSEILKGKDVLAVMPTSMGKSLCFQFPAVIRKGITVVVEPLVALLSDQSKNLNSELPVSIAVYVNPFAMNEAELDRKRILYVSPETLNHDKFVRYIKKRADELQMLVVDEAHCISVWGSEFREDYLKIGQFFDKIARRPQVVAFTATATKLIRDEIADVLRMKKDNTFDLVKHTERYPLNIQKNLFIRNNITMKTKEISCAAYEKYLHDAAESLGSAGKTGKYSSNESLKRMAVPFRAIILSDKKSSDKADLDKKRKKLETVIKYINEMLIKNRRVKSIDVSEAQDTVKDVFPDNHLDHSEMFLIRCWCVRWLVDPNSKTLAEEAAADYCRIISKESKAELYDKMFDDKIGELVDDIFEALKAGEEDEQKKGSVIVYCSEIATLNKLCEYPNLQKKLEEKVRVYSLNDNDSFSRLRKRNDGKILVPVLNYYAELKSKKKNQRYFIENTNEYPVIVATKAFGMGINKKDVRRVIHFEPPKDIENYFQEVGRGGRDNLASDAILYIYKPDIERAEWLLSQEKNAGEKPSARRREAVDMMNYNLEIAIHRFRQFKARCLSADNDQQLSDSIAEYFLNDDFIYDKAFPPMEEVKDKNKLTPERRKAIYNKKKNGIDRIVFNISQPAREIRDGTYLTGNDRPDGEKHFLWLSGHADLTDLLIANAVYTLGSSGQTSISVNKIFQLITGDSRFRLEPKIRKEMLERIVRLTETDVIIRYKQDEYKGKFLYLETDERFVRYIKGTEEIADNERNGIKIKFTYTGVPAIFQYAEVSGMMWYVPFDWLLIQNDRNKKLIPDTPENIILKAYIAWRIHMLPRYRTGYCPYDKFTMNDRMFIEKTRAENSAVYKWISLLPSRSDRKGLYELLGIDVFENDGKTLCLDKLLHVQQTLKIILGRYVRMGIIKAYRFHSKGDIYTTVELDRLGSKKKEKAEVTLPELSEMPAADKHRIKVPRHDPQDLCGYKITLTQEYLNSYAFKKQSKELTLELIPESVMKKLKEYTGTKLSAFDHAVMSCVLQIKKHGSDHIVPRKVFSLLCGDEITSPARAICDSIIKSIEKLRSARVSFKDSEGKEIFTASLLPLEKSSAVDEGVTVGSYRYKVPGIVSVLTDTFCTYLTEDKSIDLDELDMLILKAAVSVCRIEKQRRDETFEYGQEPTVESAFSFKSEAKADEYIYLMKKLTISELPQYIAKALNGKDLIVRRDTQKASNDLSRLGIDIIQQRLKKMCGISIICPDIYKKKILEQYAEERKALCDEMLETELEYDLCDEIIKFFDARIGYLKKEITAFKKTIESVNNYHRCIMRKLKSIQKKINKEQQKKNGFVKEQMERESELNEIKKKTVTLENETEKIRKQRKQTKSKEEKDCLKETLSSIKHELSESRKEKRRIKSKLETKIRQINRIHIRERELYEERRTICHFFRISTLVSVKIDKHKQSLLDEKEQKKAQRKDKKRSYRSLQNRIDSLRQRIHTFSPTNITELDLLSVNTSNNEIVINNDKNHLIYYLDKEMNTFAVDKALLCLEDKNGRDIVGTRYDEILLKLVLASRLTQFADSKTGEGELDLRKKPSDLYGFAAELKDAAFVPKPKGKRTKEELTMLKNKRFEQLCNKLQKALVYYQNNDIVQNAEPVLKKTDKDSNSSK